MLNMLEKYFNESAKNPGMIEKELTVALEVAPRRPIPKVLILVRVPFMRVRG